MNQLEITEAIKNSFPMCRELIMHNITTAYDLDYLVLRVSYYDEFDQFNYVEVSIAQRLLVRLDEVSLGIEVYDKIYRALLDEVIRSRYEQWHLRNTGPDSLEEYTGLDIDQYEEYTKTGNLPEGWKAPWQLES